LTNSNQSRKQRKPKRGFVESSIDRLHRVQSNQRFRHIFRVHRMTNEEERIQYMQAAEIESYTYNLDTVQRSSEVLREAPNTRPFLETYSEGAGSWNVIKLPKQSQQLSNDVRYSSLNLIVE
jgi:hypothetical protein